LHDKLDTAGRAAGVIPADMPKPNVRFIVDSTVTTAWTGGATVCLDAPIQFEGNTAPLSEDFALTASAGAIIPRQSKECFTSTTAADSIEALRTGMWANVGCTTTTGEDGITEIPTSCPWVAGTGDGSTRTAVMIPATDIFVGVAMMAYFDEPMMIATIAHELGHFYGRHVSSAFAHRFTYFKAEDRTTKDLPAMDTDLQETGDYLLSTSDAWSPLSPDPTLVEQLQLAADAGMATLSTEGMANEFAIDLLKAAGEDPLAMITLYIRIQKFQESRWGSMPGGRTGEDCAAEAAAGFRSEDDQLVIPGIGPIAFHHQPCHEAFNTLRQMEVRGYAEAPLQVTMPTARVESTTFTAMREELGIQPAAGF
jgi:hypothetical protein